MAMQNMNPSAPPMDEEVDDFQWISNAMKNENNGNNDNKNVYPVLQPNDNNNNNNNTPQTQIQGFVQPSDMPIPNAIQQQLIYQQIQDEQRKKKEAEAAKSRPPPQPQQEQEQKQANMNVMAGPKPSYMAANIVYPETALYKAAGICIWRAKENGKGIELMMGLEKNANTLTFFGGKRSDTDKSCIDTAMREFHQQTANKLDDETLAQMRRMLMTDKDRKLFWKAEWNSVLFYYQMSYDYNLVKDYTKYKLWNAKMKNLHWVDFEKVYNSVFCTGNAVKISKTKYALQTFVVGTMLHEENKKYLLDLHTKYGGDMNKIKPKYGGTIRNTSKSFNDIPKAIRLDILNPITHTALYHKWVEMNIADIEDYQLLTSLITSICPEIGRNFVLYYTGNDYFKTSKNQYPIDTIPAFTNLKQQISDKKSSHFVTRLYILPTFIISDNFKGISFAFKAKDISWKVINPSSDDEKGSGIVSSIYNKAQNVAQAWFGNNDCMDDDDGDMSWKWQFMNDNNKFQDFGDKNSNIIETSFISGYSFTNFKRLGINYQANFKTMCQKNLNSNKIRAIRRVPGAVKGDESNVNNNNNNNNNAGYYYKAPALQYYKWQYQENDGTWSDYEVAISKQLNSFKVRWDANVQNYHYHIYQSKKHFDSRFTFQTQIKNTNNNLTYNYLIDVKHFKQRNVETRKERNVRQIPVYDNQYGYNHGYNQPSFLNHNPVQYKWQYKDDGYNNWKDYDSSTSQYIEQQYIHNSYQSFTVTCNNYKNYKIQFNTMQQQCLSSGKHRAIRRQPLLQAIGGPMGPMKHRWEWQDDDGTWKKYDTSTSKQIESACNKGIKKYFFVSSKNNNSYEINFHTFRQFNVQTGKQRNVRKIALEPEWKGAGPNPKKYKGPVGADRRTFDKKCIDLYCIVGDSVADEVRKCGKLIRGSLGPFGCGLYFYDSIEGTKKMAQDRTNSNKGNLIKAKVFVGKELDVSAQDDKDFDFQTLQKMAYDSVSRSLGFGKQYIVYNVDQVCIIKNEKYY